MRSTTKASTGNFVLLAMVIVVTLSAAGGCSRSQNDPNKNQSANDPTPVRVVKIKPVAIKDVLVLPGETEARHDVTLSAERDGRVEWVGPREGRRVKKGDLICKIDVTSLQAALERARAAYKLAEDVAGRRESLKKERIISQEELERSSTERIKAQYILKEAEVRYAQGFVLSPIDGVVNRLFVDPGEFVNRGHKVAEIVDTRRIRINVRVPELDVRWLKTWRSVSVTIDAYPGAKWQGLIDFISYKADPATKTFKVRVVVDNEDGRIRPGMIARVSFLRREIPNALVVPLSAILEKGGERIVFVEENGVAQARTIIPGVIDGDRCQVVKGLQPGDNLIVSGLQDIEEGMKVIIR